jgi:hypothetical protein
VKVESDDLRVVLFGLPASGKSSLLGALGQAAASQEHLLGGKLEDRSNKLSELSQPSAPEQAPTPGEIVSYSVRYDPHPNEGVAPRPIEAVLLDCDGQAVIELLHKEELLEQECPEGTLAFEISDADTLILLIDASAPTEQVDANFAAFSNFLEAMQESRGERAEIAGLPVYLVLTKCDRLAQPGDNAGAWMERIEQRKREVGERFRAFLASQPSSAPYCPFGRINLHVWATAVKRPALGSTPSKSQEPYGVAELFRQCLSEAARFRQRWDRSQRRLTGLMVGAGLLVGLMTTLTITLFAFHIGSRANLLQARVEDFRFLDGTSPAERLKGSPEQLRVREQRLEEIRDDPQYSRLREDLRTFVENRLDEVTNYIPYLEKVLQLKSLSSEQTEEGLEGTIHRLREELGPPREEWADTPAAQLRKQRLDTGEALRKAMHAARNWYLEQNDQAGRLWTFADYLPPADLDWADWAAKVEKLIDPRQRPPFRDNEPVPGVPGGALLFSQVQRFDRVVDARAAWETEKARLMSVLNITTALGLAPVSKDRPPALVFSRDLTLTQCKDRLRMLKSAYPDYERGFIRDGLPEAILSRVRLAARRQYDVLLEPARAEVLRQLRLGGTGKDETPARWEAVRVWLREPEELRAWSELARVLGRLDDPVSALPPTRALAEFLNKPQFTIEAKTISVEIPESRGLRIADEARLLIQHSNGDQLTTLAFLRSGDPTRDAVRRLRIYTYRPVEGHRLVYRPGDKLWAELPLSGGKEKLVWSQARSNLYLFERLRQPPRLQNVSATSLDEGRLLDDVRLGTRPDEGVPTVPDLIPRVTLTER